MKLHKHIAHSIYVPYGIYFVTTVVNNRLRYFKDKRYQFILLKNIAITKVLKDFGVNALAILPDHIHLLLQIGSYSVSRIMQSIKLNSTKDINLILKPEEPFCWQPSFLDHLIRSNDDCRERLAYIMTNAEHHRLEGFTWAAPLSLSPTEEDRYDRLQALIAQMSAQTKRLSAARTPDKKTIISRQIATADRQIDSLVYELHGLTEEEIKIVECGEGSSLRKSEARLRKPSGDCESPPQSKKQINQYIL